MPCLCVSDRDEAKENSSSEAVVTALVTNLVIAVVEIAVFVALFRYIPVIYEPRTYLPRLSKLRAPKLPRSLWRWAFAIYEAPREKIIEQNGLDAFMFLQFLFMMMEIFFPMWLFSWIILLPVNSVNSGSTQKGMYRFTFGNVGVNKQSRYAAHVIFAYGLTIWVLYLTKREMGRFIKLRQRFLSSSDHIKLAQAKTVLVTGLPQEFRNEKALQKLTEYMPGGAARIWLVRNLGSKMVDLYERQSKAASKLESSETQLFKTAIKRRNKDEKASAKQNKSGKKQTQNNSDNLQVLSNASDAEQAANLIESFVPRSDRPTFRQGKVPFFGKKLDTIDWAKDELVNTTRDLEEERARLQEKPADSAAFIEFETQIAAHIFQQSTTHHLPLRMASKYIEVSPDDVIFNNLGVDPYQAKIRYAISWAATIGLVIGWSPIVTFIGLLSNVNQLCAKVSWLRWLCGLHKPLNGIIQGLLPPVALAILFMLLPIVLRLLARFEGIPLRTKVELSLMNRYFIFLVIYGLLIVTLAAGLTSALPKIAQNPGSAVTLLAQNLPNASNFYISYLITTGLSGIGGAFISIFTLILHYIFLYLLATVPRKTYQINYQMQSSQWGTLFPNITLLTVIGLTYCIISPIINGFAAVTFALFAYCYKYLWIYVYDFPAASETGGLFFPLAINHVYVGLYIMQICLTGLFFLARNAQDQVSALPQAILMIILIVFTALFHLLLNTSYGPLIRNLPLDLGIQIDDEDTHRLTPSQKNDLLAQSKFNFERIALEPIALAQKVAGETDKFRRDVTNAAAGFGRNVANRPRELFRRRGSRRATLEENSEAERSEEATAINATSSESNEKHNNRITKTAAEEEGTEVSEHAFDHPAAWQPMLPIWLPEDPLGLSVYEVADIRALGIECTTSGAFLNEKGQCRITRPPPEIDFESVGNQRMPAYDSNASSPENPHRFQPESKAQQTDQRNSESEEQYNMQPLMAERGRENRQSLGNRETFEEVGQNLPDPVPQV